MAFADEMLWKQAQEAESLSSCSRYSIVEKCCLFLLPIATHIVLLRRIPPP